MFLIRCVIFTMAAILGAGLSRWHGGGFFPAPKWLKNLLFALPIGLSLVFVSYQYFSLLGLGEIADLFAALVATISILAFKAIGHGGGFDLGHSKQEPGNGRELEKIERWFFLYPHLFNKLPRYWYDMVILAIKGGLMSLSPAVILGFTSAASAVIMLLGGLVGFPVSYAIGWWLHDHTKLLQKFNAEPNEPAEWISGGLFFGSFVLALFVVI